MIANAFARPYLNLGFIPGDGEKRTALQSALHQRRERLGMRLTKLEPFGPYRAGALTGERPRGYTR